METWAATGGGSIGRRPCWKRKETLRSPSHPKPRKPAPGRTATQSSEHPLGSRRGSRRAASRSPVDHWGENLSSRPENPESWGVLHLSRLPQVTPIVGQDEL